jgi:hypothetical protein
LTPANKLATDATGRVTVGTNDDKNGYSLTQGFPANFASLGINSSGHVSRVVLVDTTTANSDMLTANQAVKGLVTGSQPAGSLARFVREIKSGGVLFEGQIVTAGSNTATLDAGATTVCIGQAIVIGEEGDAERQTRWVTAFDEITKIITTDKPWCIVPPNGSDYQIVTLRRSINESETQTAAAAAITAANLALETTAGSAKVAAEAAAAALDDLTETDDNQLRFTEKALEQAPAGGGGSGDKDWTNTERAQIRYRLGIDGSASEPTTATPNLGSLSAIVNVLPAVGISADRSPGVTLKAFVGETITQAITLYQTDGTTPFVMTGKTLIIVFETRQGLDVATIANEVITVGGDDDNVITFAYPAAATANERTLRFALRDAGSPNTVYLQGLLSVQRAPKVDPS